MTEAKDESRERPRESFVTLIPRLGKFLWHLVKDPRVPWMVKASLAGLAAYLASPLDIIPDWIPGAGYLDDVLIAGFVVSYVLAQVPPEVVREHWGEDVEMLEDLVLAAVNQAREKAAQLQAENLAKLTGGLKIPGLSI